MDQPGFKYLPGVSSFACFLQGRDRTSVIDGQSQFSFTLLASLRDRLFPYQHRNWKASSCAFLSRGVQTRDLHMICGPLLGTGMHSPLAWPGTSFVQKKGMLPHTTAGVLVPIPAVRRLSEGLWPA